MHLHSTTIPQPRSSHSQTNPNHYSTILRVESKNDSDTTIHIRDSPNPTQPCINKKRRGKSAAPVSTHRPETVVSQSHTDFSRVERVESVAPLDAKRPYSTLRFSEAPTMPDSAMAIITTTSRAFILTPFVSIPCKNAEDGGRSYCLAALSTKSRPFRCTAA